MRWWLLCPLALAASACGSDKKQGPCAVEDRAGYPTGAYGVAAGDILEELEFVTVNNDPLALGEIHADGTNRLLVLNTAAGWCSACIEEAPALESLHQRYGDRCVYVMTAVFEDAIFKPATAAIAGDWREQFDLTFTVVADPDFALEAYYDRNLTPMTMLVDLNNMEILRIRTGNDPASIEALIEARL